MSSCRFCCETLPTTIGSSLSNCEILVMLNVLQSNLVSMINDISKTSTICPSCATLLKTTYNFKVLCTATETKLQSNFDATMNLESGCSDLVSILEREKGIRIPANTPICRTCLQEVIGGEFLSANGKIVGVQQEIREMLNVCSSEMNLLLTKEPIICKNCMEMLLMSFEFHSKCAASNKKSSHNQDIEQNQSTISSLLELAGKSDENTVAASQLKLPSIPEIENVKIEKEISDNDESENAYLNEAADGDVPSDLWVVKKMVPFPDKNPRKDCQIINESNGRNESKPNSTGIKYYFCKTCTYRTKRKAFLLKHKVVHYPGYKKTTFKCKECGYTVKRQKYLDQHLSLHAKGIDFKKHKCSLCSFCTRKKSKLERHMTVHKDERDTVMYKCSKCNFITKWKEYLTQHELIHNGSEVEKKFKCSECSFSTNWRGSLVQHKVVHISEEEALKFQCMECPFKTKRKDNLTKHMIRHMKIEDVRIFYCPECQFTSKYSSKLSRHLHVHKKRDELTIHKCSECPFQTKWKNNLSQHMRVHQNASEFELFKCKDCSFTTKWKTCLTEHLVMHKTGDDSKEFKCTECDFCTKWKKSLSMHQLTHSSDEAIKKFKCEICEYKTYRSHHLKRHMKVHAK